MVVNHMKILIHRKDAKNAKNLIAKIIEDFAIFAPLR